MLNFTANLKEDLKQVPLITYVVKPMKIRA